MNHLGQWAQTGQRLWGQLVPYLDAELQLHSRIHQLWANTPPGTEIWVKRDDELGGWLGGGKWRKYASLLPHLRAVGVQNAVLIGGAHSNHLATLVPLLTQSGIAAHVLARGEAHGPDTGNRLWLRTALAPERLRWVARSEWPYVAHIAKEWAQTLEKQGKPTFILPEGGAHPACAGGSLTLAADVLSHCDSLPFDHLFADAGTGYMASALAHGLGWAGYPGGVHAVLMAEDEAAFRAHCATYSLGFHDILPAKVKIPNTHLPLLAPRFGQVNADVLAFVRQAARQWGLWLDPVYGAKLVHTVLTKVQSGEISGRVLVIHGGGMSGLGGFADKLAAGLVG